MRARMSGIQKDKGRQLPVSSKRGFASIIVTTVLIAIIGLMLVGFSLTVRKNQQETLDRQLSTQAYYAAETAVDKARAIAIQTFNETGQVATNATCTSDNQVSDVSGVSAPCVTVDGSLESMFYNSVTEGQDTFAAVIPTNAGDTVNRLVVTWKPTAYVANAQSGCAGGTGQLPPRANWPPSCKYGVLRLDITAPNNSGNFDPNAFATTVLLLPSGGGVNPSLLGPIIVQPGGAYRVAADSCGDMNANPCSATIDINGAFTAPGKNFYIRMRSIYNNSSVDIEPRNSIANANVETKGQVLIDATGKSQDVLRRIQVRVPVVSSSVNNPFGAIESTGSICKRFAVAPGYLGGGGIGNELCQP